MIVLGSVLVELVAWGQLASGCIRFCHGQFLAAGFGEAGFEVLDSAASIWQLLSGGISYTILMLEPTSITNTAECSAAKPGVEKAAGLFAALSNTHGNLPI